MTYKYEDGQRLKLADGTEAVFRGTEQRHNGKQLVKLEIPPMKIPIAFEPSWLRGATVVAGLLLMFGCEPDTVPACYQQVAGAKAEALTAAAGCAAGQAKLKFLLGREYHCGDWSSGNVSQTCTTRSGKRFYAKLAQRSGADNGEYFVDRRFPQNVNFEPWLTATCSCTTSPQAQCFVQEKQP